jgi:hypothetical protein
MSGRKRGLNLTRVFHFRVSEEEWQWIKKLSSDLGLSPGSYLRMEIHKRAKELMEAKEVPPEIESEQLIRRQMQIK